jgi:hypothetical protein
MFVEIKPLDFEVDYKQQQLLLDDRHHYQDRLFKILIDKTKKNSQNKTYVPRDKQSSPC